MPPEHAPVAALPGKQTANPSSKKSRHKKAADQAKSAGITDTTQVVPDTTQPGPSSAPIALDLPNSLAIDDESEEYEDVDSDFEELVFHGTKWFPRSKYVRGRKLPNVRDLEDSPASNEMSPLQLTAWGFKSINEHASKAVKKLAKDITLARRTLNPRIDEDDKPVQFNGGTRSNADAIWHQLFGHEHSGSARCRHCREGCGPFAECVQVVDACANCRYGGTAVRCEFHPRNVTPAKRKAEESMDAPDEDTVSDILSKIPAKYLKEVRRAIDMALTR